MAGDTCPIVTLTPSPTLDRTYFVKNLVEGGVNRADRVGEELAGKGINVSRGLHLAGIPAPGIVPIGDADKGVLDRTGSGFLTPLWVEGTLRVSTTVVEYDGPTTKINEHPRPLKQKDWDAVIELTEKTVREQKAKWLVVAGAHPEIEETGEVINLHSLFLRMEALGVKVVLDTSGPALRYWAQQGNATVMKPNAHELAECVGKDLKTIGDVIDAANTLNDWGVDCVMASLGVDGIIAVTKTHAIHAFTPPVKVINTVGAGDSTIAGFLSAVTTHPAEPNAFGVGFDVAEGIAAAVQWGAAKVQQPTSGLQSIENLVEATVDVSPDRDRLLGEPATA
ncbi:MAG: PfkB family carbohydrate kinase [Aquiluna sp.]|jgi:1-phosphofructokinase|nr:PfkB family carbohydrate kinase [Aquiluna sp.]